LATGFASEVDCSDFLGALGVEHSAMWRQALWRAGQAVRDYRRQGGSKTNVLADFFIGAQASVLGAPIFARDLGQYRTYFPGDRTGEAVTHCVAGNYVLFFKK
jgi:hypothetical protein